MRKVLAVCVMLGFVTGAWALAADTTAPPAPASAGQAATPAEKPATQRAGEPVPQSGSKPTAATEEKESFTPGETGMPPAAEIAALPFKTEKENTSYALGLVLGRNWKTQSIDVDVEIFAQALRDSLAGKKLLMTDEQAQRTMVLLQRKVMAEREEKAKELAAKNKKNGEAFLEKNKNKEGVVTLKSGLQYKVIKEGDGPMPKQTDTVMVNYRGTLIDGTEFDSSAKSGGPVALTVNGVIAGMSEALKLMKVGSKWQLFIPSDLAYGERSPSPAIGPSSVLIFEVELVSIK